MIFSNYDSEIIDQVLDGLNYQKSHWSDSMNRSELAECIMCNSAWWVTHEYCDEYIDQCVCSDKDIDQNGTFQCANCNIEFNVFDGTLKDLDNQGKTINNQDTLWDDDIDSYWDGSPYTTNIKPPADKKTTATTTSKATTTTTYTAKCRHKHQKVILADGTPIYCSSVNKKLEEDQEQRVADFGLYADHSWKPYWRNEFIDWPDMKIPTDYDMALTQIWEAYCRAADNDEFVEIGCIGGHGRTGVILAIMHIGAAEGEVTAEEAIKFVHKEYCSHAIETAKQEWFINYASHKWFGHDLAPEPADPVYKTYTGQTGGSSCQVVDHYAMMLRGHVRCILKDNCYFWDQDVKAFQNPTEATLKNAMKKLNNYTLRPGGIVLDSDKKAGCSMLSHTAMLMNGHTKCISLGDDCTKWDSHFKEYKEKGTILGIKIMKTDMLNKLLEDYPKAEDSNAEDPF